jgi:hypothetical protein
MSAAEFRELQGRPKAPVQGPAAPHAVKGKPQYALGRLPQGVMNKTEERFLAEYITPFSAAGEIVWWAFEGIKLRIAPNTFITVDFALMRANGAFELVDVKAQRFLVEDDAHVKMKVAADRYPFRFFYAWPMGGTTAKTKGWHFEAVGRE